MEKQRRIAYFISSHGFGHAARASAVIESLRKTNPNFIFDIFTEVPQWFFKGGIEQGFYYHRLQSDIGIVQRTALEEDMPETLRRLGQLLPFNQSLIRDLVNKIQDQNPPCEAVICDIDPIGVSVARQLDVPSILIENFTWDWIYQNYNNLELAGHGRYLRSRFDSADYRIQTQPVCQVKNNATSTVSPIARVARKSKAEIRKQLGIPPDALLTLINIGGSMWEDKDSLVMQLIEQTEVHVVLIGSHIAPKKTERLLVLSPDSDLYYPDILNASDAVLAKLGYSTLAEVYVSGTRYGYIPRTNSPEAPYLDEYAQAHTACTRFNAEDLQGDEGIIKLHHLLLLKRQPHEEDNGANQVAEQIIKIIDKK